MAKLIKLTQDVIEEIKKEFDAYVRDKISDGRISFQKTVNTVNRKATVYFTELAYRKMQALVDGFNNEISWHGLACRGKDESKDEYYITDILVYPQEVTSATVTTDQNKYQTWLMNHDDETFNNIRMQGHSHVNMGVTPSGVDENFYESILAQLDDNMFYIFQIWNKKGDKTCKIYDLKKNIMFDTADCEIKILPSTPDGAKIFGVSAEEEQAMLEALTKLRHDKICKQFVEDAKKLVTTRTYTSTVSPRVAYFGGRDCIGYYNSYSNTPSDKKKRKGKRKDTTVTSYQGYTDDDDEDNIYGYTSKLWT